MPRLRIRQRPRPTLRRQAAAALELDAQAPGDRLAFAITLLGADHELTPQHVTAALAIASAPIFGDQRPLQILAAALSDLADSDQPNHLRTLGLSELSSELALHLTRFARRTHSSQRPAHPDSARP